MNRSTAVALVIAVSLMTIAYCAEATRGRTTPFVVSDSPDGKKHISMRVSGTTYEGIVDYESSDISDRKAFAGQLERMVGSFALVEIKGSQFLSIYLPNKVVEVFPGRDGLPPVVQETTTTNLPCGTSLPAPMVSAGAGCGDTVCNEARAAVQPDSLRSIAACEVNPGTADPPVVIKALIAYSDDVDRKMGADNVDPLIDKAVANTNLAFKNSKVGAVLVIPNDDARTRCTRKISYTEGVLENYMHDDLKRLFNPLDYELSSLHTIRDNCHADVVLFITENKEALISGRACVMNYLSVNYAPYAFAVVKRTSITANHAFTHELGHMMGAGHERVTSACHDGMCPDSAAWTYSWAARTYGPRMKQFPTVYLETVMGNEVGRYNVLTFSDPGIVYRGVTTGGPLANNARTLRLSAPVVATFRIP